jgi:hypothetical protein
VVVDAGHVRGGRVECGGHREHRPGVPQHGEPGPGLVPGHADMAISPFCLIPGLAACSYGSKACVRIIGTGGDTLGDEIIPHPLRTLEA